MRFPSPTPRASCPARSTLIVALALWAMPVLASDPRAELASLCAQLAAGCQTCGKAPAERTAAAMSSAPAPPAKPVDEWGNPIRISINNGGLRVESAGPDGAFGTADDLVERCAMP